MDANSDLSRLTELAGGLGLHEHHCVIYETAEQQLAAAVPFLRSGLDRRETCLYIADEKGRAAVLQALRDEGTDVERHLRSGSLVLADQQETYLGHGHFDPDLWMRFLYQLTHEAGRGKVSGARTLIGEVTAAMGENVAGHSLIEYEAKLNDFVRDHDIRVLCQYNRNWFSAEVILAIIRTHPVVVYGGIICKNPYYVPPEELLKPNQPSLEVERLLNNILKWQQSFDRFRALNARLESIREEERKTVAREIHDELGQALTAIKLDLASLLRELSADAEQKTKGESILKLVDHTIQVVRQISTELRPGILDDLGLVAGVEWAAEEFGRRTGTRYRVDLPKEALEIEPELATAIFRILQETLTNIARHANATRVDIRLAREGDNLTLEVHDDGTGIGEEQLSGRGSLGILGMRERALLLGGEFLISGAPNQGTRVVVRVPLSASRHGERTA